MTAVALGLFFSFVSSPHKQDKDPFSFSNHTILPARICMDMAVETYLLIPALRSFVHWKGGCLVSKSADIASGLFQRLFGRSDIGMDLWHLDLLHAPKNPGHGKGSARAPSTEGKSRCGTGADPARIIVPDVFPISKARPWDVSVSPCREYPGVSRRNQAGLQLLSAGRPCFL